MDNKQLTLSPEEAHEMEQRYRVVKRSVDARQRNLKVLLTLLTDERGNYIPREAPVPLYEPPHFQDVHGAPHTAVIVGAGPAGLFAALRLLELGIRPVIYERGKEVSARKVDIARLNRNLGLNTESNYCFGEGGAGTFSDGKLFSRSKKRGNMQQVMEWFHYFGAADRVLYEAHAHIGSDKLPSIIKAMRECILAHGGEIHFETVVDDSLLTELLEGTKKGVPVILAIGHSAHDTYRLLWNKGVALEEKGYAMGVRVEHPQSLINNLMYHGQPQSVIDLVGNASYSFVTQVNGRGVYSFCMCPGGHIVPAGSSAESCVVNGMSASHRNSPYANSGIVVELRPEDIPAILTSLPDTQHYTHSTAHSLRAGNPHSIPSLHTGNLSSIYSPQTNNLSSIIYSLSEEYNTAPLPTLLFQEWLEHTAYLHGGSANQAPAQRLRDFVDGRASANLPSCSYLPGIVPSRLDEWLPAAIGSRLQQGFRDFARKYSPRGNEANSKYNKGNSVSKSTHDQRNSGFESTSPSFLTNEAVILGVESRSSSAVRIPRDPDTLQSISTPWLFPCGEGAGYAGGITSSALDGLNASSRLASLWQ